ncbi:internal head protein [Pseudomonas phage Noxifer]|uniref:Virion structural protein n=1 Tax=Pseudomonas phage Noxifer TaxID=2006684 RepID=A0A1Y0SXK7_9CAUD|nr:internal head protein [Pseudomonas phage Noxifer]ARV77265.1 virion structural protein [Pseudomonas phage Noxifer]
MSEHLGEAKDEQYVMDGDSDIEKLHNRLNPPGTLALANNFFGGMSQGYYSGEDFNVLTDDQVSNNAKYIAELLSTDNENALSVLRLVDSTEDYHSHPPIDPNLFSVEVSQEDMAQSSLSALKTIFGWTKSVAKQIFNDMTNYELIARYLSFHAANIQTLARDRRKTTQFTNAPLVVNTRIANLSIRYEPVKDVAGLLTALRILSNVTKDYYSYNDDNLLKVADRLPSMIHDADMLQGALVNASPAQLMRTTSFYPGNEPDTHVTAHMLGCHRVSIKTQYGTGVLDQRFTVRLVPSDTTPRPLPDKIEFKRFTIQAMDQVLRQVQDIAAYLQEVNTPMIRQRRMARIERISLLTTKVAKEIQTTGFDSERHRKVIALVNQYNDWITSPYKELYGLVCRDLRAVLNVCELNAQ